RQLHADPLLEIGPARPSQRYRLYKRGVLPGARPNGAANLQLPILQLREHVEHDHAAAALPELPRDSPVRAYVVPTVSRASMTDLARLTIANARRWATGHSLETDGP